MFRVYKQTCAIAYRSSARASSNLFVRFFLGTASTNMADKTLDVSSMRRSYDVGPFSEENLVTKEPFGQFDAWIKEAAKVDPEVIGEVNAMALSTCSRDGKPSVRYVLLKDYGKEGFTFFTNYNSTKGKQLEENPYASLLFFWHPLSRQVRIDGRVVKISAEKSDKYFHQRPIGSQIGACASNQGEVIPSKQFLIDKASDLHKAYVEDGKEIPKPDSWGGYIVIPDLIEFWQGQKNRLHDRIVFRRPTPGEEVSESSLTKPGEDGWVYERISP